MNTFPGISGKGRLVNMENINMESQLFISTEPNHTFDFIGDLLPVFCHIPVEFSSGW